MRRGFERGAGQLRGITRQLGRRDLAPDIALAGKATQPRCDPGIARRYKSALDRHVASNAVCRRHDFQVGAMVDPLEPVIGNHRQVVILRQRLHDVADQFV